MKNPDAYFVLVNKPVGTNIPDDLLRHYNFFEKFIRPLHESGALQAMTRMATRRFSTTNIYPWYQFAHEDGIVHMFFEDGTGKKADEFMDRTMDVLIDKGEFMDKVPDDLIGLLSAKEHEYKVVLTDVRNSIWKSYKNSK